MPDFRFEGLTTSGQVVQGFISAESQTGAKKKISQLGERRRFKLTRIQKRKTYLYKVRRGKEKPITGEQKAFNKDEVRQALDKLGYEVVSVFPKLLDFQLKPPATDIVTFVRVSADLLQQELSYNEVLQLLVNDIENPSLRESVRAINNDLRSGKDSEEAFMKQEKILGKFTARMLGLASKSGNMAEIYESTAKFLERNAEFKKNIRSALIMPIFTLIILFIAVAFYVGYIFPETAELFKNIGVELPPMTKATLEVSYFLQEYFFLITLIHIAIFAGIFIYLRSPKGQMFKDRHLIKMPIMGSLIHKTNIEIFCRVFYSLYSGSGENIDAIKLAAEACGNKYMEARIKDISIPMMLSKGRGLVESLEESGVFTKTALARFNSGAETGTIKNSAMQIANYYEKETVYKLKNVVDFIQIIIAMVIMIVMTALTLISAETATVSPTIK
jgi:type IV pilus assembly protein PilC